MRSGFRLLPAASVLLAAFSGPAAAQRESYSFVSYAGTEVSLVSSATDEETARINTPILSGDRLVTGGSSRAEAVLASGNIVRLDAKSELRFDRMVRTYESDDERDLLYLLKGDVAIDVRDAETGDRAFRLDTDDATVVVEGTGQIRVDVGRRGTEVYVTAGEASVTGRGGAVVLQAGQYAYVRGADAVEAEWYDPPQDRFARFVNERRDRKPPPSTAGTIGSDYDYEAAQAGFDENGSWFYSSAYDRWCWRPTVAADWSPYSLGYWRWTPGGLTWVSYEPWGWLPYHYGTWCFDDGFGWYWMPGSVYAPAWVYWCYTPSWIGWCPTGYYGYYDSYYRDACRWYGSDGGYLRHPYLRGRVDVSRIDPRGWNFASSNRIGLRLDPGRDIVRGDRVTRRPGQAGVVATAPLRIDRGSLNAPAAVQTAVGRIAGGGRGAPARVDEGLTEILGRGSVLPQEGQQELRRSILTSGRPEMLRPLSPDQVLTPRGATEAFARPGDAVTRSGRDAVATGSGDGWRTASLPDRGAGTVGSSAPRRRDDGWRSPASPAPRDVSPRQTDRVRPSDTGWRAPRVAPRTNASETPARRSESDWREAPAPRAAPRDDATGAPSKRRSEADWREAPPARSDTPMRYSGRPSRSNEPADRSSGPAARSYESPGRSGAPSAAAPRYAPGPSPRGAAPSAPAPGRPPRRTPRRLPTRRPRSADGRPSPRL